MAEENKEAPPAGGAESGGENSADFPSGASESQQTPAPSPKANPELALIGQEISGCVILEKISSGGMGTVFKAKHKALDRIVCVKILSPLLADDKKAVGLFLTEARAIAEIDHPNIVFVYNVGREKGFYFLVMSYIEGESLSAIVRKKPNLPISFVVDTFIGILRGLEAAHKKGIIHRDIKPSNILINKKLEPKIVDFGIAKKVDKEKGFAKTTELAGTAYFLSPEQALGRPIDTRADLYAVGASMFYVLTGRYPFTGKNSMEIIQKHINEPAPDIAAYRRGVPPWLAAGVAKLMSKNPKDRFQTATEALIYMQKSRADDNLKTGQGVNLSEEMGLKVSDFDIMASPRADENSARQQVNRFNMETNQRSPSSPNRISIPIVSLTNIDSAPRQSVEEEQKPVSRSFFNFRPKAEPDKTFQKEFETEKNPRNFFSRGLLLTLLAAAMLGAACILFLKLGAICSAFDISERDLFAALVTPWTSSQGFMPGQTMWTAICFVFTAFTASMLFFRHIRKIVPFAFITAAASYVAALYALAPAPVYSLFAHTFLPVYAFLLGALGMAVSWKNYYPLWMRACGALFFFAAFVCVYLFTKPLYFAQGPLTAPLLYSALGLVAVALAMPFMKGRVMAVVFFAAACCVISAYQASGNVYDIVKQAAHKPAVAQAGDNNGPRAEFINKLRAAAPQMSAADMERHAWVFALREPAEKFKLNYKEDGFVFFAILAFMTYGLLAFMLALYDEGEDKWNLT